MASCERAPGKRIVIVSLAMLVVVAPVGPAHGFVGDPYPALDDGGSIGSDLEKTVAIGIFVLGAATAIAIIAMMGREHPAEEDEEPYYSYPDPPEPAGQWIPELGASFTEDGGIAVLEWDF